MKKYYLILMLLMLLTTTVYAFNCQLDGTCFMNCMEEEDDMTYCMNKCTRCNP